MNAQHSSKSHRVLISYLSTSTGSRRIADALGNYLRGLFSIDTAPIRPVRNYRRPIWGLLSIIPRFSTKIGPANEDLSPYDLLILITPKWTNNCPPVTSYINGLQNAQDKQVAIVLLCHGFGFEAYLRSLRARLERKGAKVLRGLVVKSSSVASGNFAELQDFDQEIGKELLGEEPCVCRHNYVFHGMINIRDELLGTVDVWECTHCHNSDVYDRRIGQASENRTRRFATLGSGEKWGIFICHGDGRPSWRTVRVRAGRHIPCECELTDLERSLLISRDLSLSGIGGGEALAHRLYMVEDWIWKDLELMAQA